MTTRPSRPCHRLPLLLVVGIAAALTACDAGPAPGGASSGSPSTATGPAPASGTPQAAADDAPAVLATATAAVAVDPEATTAAGDTPSVTAGRPGPDEPTELVPATTPADPEAAWRAALVERATYVDGDDYEVDAMKPVAAGDVLIEALQFDSPVESVDPRNDRVRARLFRLESPEPAAVILLGGWKFDPFTPTIAQDFAKAGLHALYLEIPFQGQRTPRGKRPGELTLSADLEQTEAVFFQLAQDVGRAVDWLVAERGVDPERIGLYGTSLGGFAASTLYGMLPRFRCCATMLSGSDVASVLFNGSWLTQPIRTEFEKQGVSEEEVRERLRGIDPGTWADPERKDGLLLVAAGADRIVPLESVRKLARLYGGAELEVVPGARHTSAAEIGTRVPLVREHLIEHLLGGN